jgi:hypothetical protein
MALMSSAASPIRSSTRAMMTSAWNAKRAGHAASNPIKFIDLVVGGLDAFDSQPRGRGYAEHVTHVSTYLAVGKLARRQFDQLQKVHSVL